MLSAQGATGRSRQFCPLHAFGTEHWEGYRGDPASPGDVREFGTEHHESVPYSNPESFARAAPRSGSSVSTPSIGSRVRFMRATAFSM